MVLEILKALRITLNPCTDSFGLTLTHGMLFVLMSAFHTVANHFKLEQMYLIGLMSMIIEANNLEHYSKGSE